MPTKKICAWCEMELGDTVANPPNRELISHGICPNCYEMQMKELDAMRNILV